MTSHTVGLRLSRIYYTRLYQDVRWSGWFTKVSRLATALPYMGGGDLELGHSPTIAIINQVICYLICSSGCCELVFGNTHRLMGRETDGSAERKPGNGIPGLELPAQPGPSQLPQVPLGRSDGENGPVTGTATLPVRY